MGLLSNERHFVAFFACLWLAARAESTKAKRRSKRRRRGIDPLPAPVVTVLPEAQEPSGGKNGIQQYRQ